jgi:anaerobic dimethyl sulfoxide reductase subunit B (iron-sulfur subunit)
MTYAFYFDSSSCTGCKACQIACKDKNELPLGVLWRRVYEVTGGEWTQTGDAWTNSIYSYNLSIACNHCVYPKCAGVCPVDAYQVRPDGIVLINTQKCIGCGYCAWACPYDAPQPDKFAGHMTKCNLCYDNLDAGLPPACVAACPMRCLELVDSADQKVDNIGLALWKIPGEEHPLPLPKLSRTEPHLVMKPHPGLKKLGENFKVSNREETSPAQPIFSARGEIPLIFFTLLGQMAIGAFGTISLIYWLSPFKQDAFKITFFPMLAVGIAIFISIISSFFHLRAPINAWRALNHLRKSWLSREILFISLFAGLWAIQTGLIFFHTSTFPKVAILSLLTSLCGIIAIYCMQRVYQLRSMPGWNLNRTFIEFSISTIGLGSFLTGLFLPHDSPALILSCIAVVGFLFFWAALVVSIYSANSGNKDTNCLRRGLIFGGILGTVNLLFWPVDAGAGTWFTIFLIAIAEETIGRWQFYSRRTPGI